MDREELSELKYRQLQKISKGKGLKANQPKEALITAILKSNLAAKSASKDAQGSDNYSGDTEIERSILEGPGSGVDKEETEEGAGVRGKLNETFEIIESSVLTNDEENGSQTKERTNILDDFGTPKRSPT